MISRSRSSTTRVSYGRRSAERAEPHDDPRQEPRDGRFPPTARSRYNTTRIPDAARPPRSRGGDVVATSLVPAVRFVRVRYAGTERRLVVLDAPTRQRYVELVARSAGAIEQLLSPS